MEGSRYWKMLGLLTEADRRQFAKVHGLGADSLQAKLLRWSLQQVASGKDGAARKEDAWQSIKPDTSFQASYYKNLVSDLQQALQHFLVQQHIQTQPGMYEQLLIAAMLTKGANPELMASLWRSALQALGGENALLPPSEARRLWELAHAIERRRPDRRQTKAANQNWWPRPPAQAASAAADLSYLVERLRMACDHGGVDTDAAISAPLLPLEGLLATLDAAQAQAQPLLQAYLCCFRLLQSGDGYEDLKRCLLQLPLPPADHFELAIHAQNYCIRRGNQGEKAYLSEYLGWMDHRVAHGLLYLHDLLPPSELKNYVTACLKTGAVDQAAAFLEQHSSHLPQDLHDKAIAFNAAHIAYARGQYSHARKLLAADPVLDHFDDLDWRSLQLKIHCALHQEGQDAEELFAYIHAFRNFLYRTKSLPPHRVQAHLRKVTYVEKAFKQPKPAQRTKLKATILADPEVADKEWVLGLLG